jgi:hypothetical protein
MTTGSALYLLMALGVFALFSVVLAYQSWQQSRRGPDMLPAQTEHEEPRGAIAA